MKNMPYSHSRIETHTNCGAKYAFAYVHKVPVEKQETSPAVERGLRLHNDIEAFFKDPTYVLSPELSFWGQWLNSLRSNYECTPEVEWALDLSWNPCAFSSPDAYIRGLYDLMVIDKSDPDTIYIKEWKTGKIYPEPHRNQRKMYALGILCSNPEVKKVRVMSVYLDQEKHEEDIFTQSQISMIKDELRTKTILMELESTWIPNPGWRCRFCDFAKGNGGPCKFG